MPEYSARGLETSSHHQCGHLRYSIPFLGKFFTDSVLQFFESLNFENFKRVARTIKNILSNNCKPQVQARFSLFSLQSLERISRKIARKCYVIGRFEKFSIKRERAPVENYKRKYTAWVRFLSTLKKTGENRPFSSNLSKN